MTKELPSNTNSSCPPIKLTNTSGMPDFPHPLARPPLLALGLFVDFVGRGVDDQQHLRAGAARLARRRRIPDILAHQHAGFHAVEDRRWWLGARA